MKKWLFIVLAVAGVTVTVAQSAMAITASPDVDKAKITLVLPEQDAVIAQNLPSTGCTPNPTRGNGLIIEFDWKANHKSAIAAYQLVAKKNTAIFPIVDATLTGTSYTYVNCNAFVPDSNLDGWAWRVRAMDDQGNFGAWMEASFTFAPCRLADGTPCE